MQVELTEDPTAFRALDWSHVVAADPSGTFFHTPAYLKLWWEEFGTGSLVLVRGSDGNQIVAACAFEVVEGSLRFLGGFDVTDYMGPVSLPGLEEEAATSILAAVTAQVGWRGADLRGLPLDSCWYAAMAKAAASLDLRVQRAEDGIAPRLSLPASNEEYLGGLTPKLRHEIRRKRRRLIEVAGAYTVTVASAPTMTWELDRFLELHRASPGPKGKFMRAGMEIFFRRLAEAFLPQQDFQMAFLEAGGEQVAGAIGFAYKDTFSLYNSAFDRSRRSVSPGMVLMAELIERSIRLGYRTFDLLKGDLEYKYRFGAEPRAIGRLLVRR